jgi:hypothetical protein
MTTLDLLLVLVIVLGSVLNLGMTLASMRKGAR